MRPRSLRLRNKPKCENISDPEACNFEQKLETSPVVTSVEMQGLDTFVFTGDRFPTEGYSVYGRFKKSRAGGILNSGQSATIVFPQGVPVAEEPERPTLVFVNNNDGSELVAHSNDTVEAIENSFTARESTANLECSFAGGCKYTVKAPGLTSSLQADESTTIEICGNTCEVDPTTSDGTQTVCTLAPLVTRYSSSAYQLVLPQVLKGSWEGSASRQELDKLSDGTKTIDIADETNSDCYFEIQSEKEGHVFVLDEARIFLNNLSDITPYVNKLTLQGS